MARRAGFTLLEICIVVFLSLLLLTIAVPSVSGLLDEQQAKRSFDELDDLVRQAQSLSVTENRAFMLVWAKEEIVVRPEKPRDAADAAGVARLPRGAMQLELPVALKEEHPAEWIFWPTGTCEPATVTSMGKGSRWIAQYNPLTVRATLTLE